WLVVLAVGDRRTRGRHDLDGLLAAGRGAGGRGRGRRPARSLVMASGWVPRDLERRGLCCTRRCGGPPSVAHTCPGRLEQRDAEVPRNQAARSGRSVVACVLPH